MRKRLLTPIVERNHASNGQSVAITFIVAVLYFISGGLGLQFAPPPGYATIIWPASGIAVASLLLFGPRYVAGVFLGAFCLNAIESGLLGEGPFNTKATYVGVGIAVGSSLQALFAYFLIRKFFGNPIKFEKTTDVALFAIIVGPIACLIAATVGVFVLHLAEILPGNLILRTWVNWWSGDLIGILVFLPLGLLSPWGAGALEWRGRPVTGLRLASITVIATALGLSFYAWKVTSEIVFERNRIAFEELADDHARALEHRLQSYVRSLDGGTGLLQASENIRLPEWRAYVDELNIGSSLPGINGIGFISDVANEDMNAFLVKAEQDGVRNLTPYPDDVSRANFIIRYIEPIEQNYQAVGLNIAFEDHRYEAATRARDEGKAIITKRIFLVQDETKNAGFLVLRPVYFNGQPLETVDQRRRAFRGWVYAPFISNRFMDQLTLSQGKTLQAKVYDGNVIDKNKLIFSSDGEAEPNSSARHTSSKTLPVLGENWTIVWESTRSFEASVRSNEPTAVLASGVSLSLLLSLYLMSAARREEAIQQKVEQKTRELKERQNENQSIVETALVSIFLLDNAGQILSANATAIDMFEYSMEELQTCSLSNLLPGDGDSCSRFKQIVETVEKANNERNAVIGFTKNGARLFLNVQLNHWTTERGEDRYTAILSDVTDEFVAKRALTQAEERWSIALSGGNIGVFDIDLQEGTSIVSSTWKTMLGFDADEDIEPQKEWQERVHPEDLPKVRKADQDCFEGKLERSECEYRIRRKDGNWIWLRSNAIVTSRTDIGIPTRFVGTQTDITALKNAEASLRASQQQLSVTISNAPIGMALVSISGNWMQANDAISEFLGFKEEVLLQTPLLQTINDPTSLKWGSLTKALLLGNTQTLQEELQFNHANGSVLWGQLNVSLAYDDHGAPSHFICQILDINDRKEMDRLKSEFISNVSHELRTPLTSIRGSLGLIAGTLAEEIPEKVMRLLTIAHQNSERLIALINDILDVEKLSTDKIVFNLKQESLQEQVQLAAVANKAYADDFGISLQVDLADTAREVHVDKARLQQILSNLISNAVKFSPKGGMVTLKVSDVGAITRISVCDKGPGIPPAFQAKLFTPFSQADGSSTRHVEGTGLGLHITKKLVERMGGAIWYSTAEDEGTIFNVDFSVPASSIDQRVEADEPKCKALHIEDDQDFSSFLALALTETIYIENAATLSAAEATLEAHAFDMLIVDISLPDGDGREIIEKLPEDWHKPVVILTADEELQDFEGADLVLVKTKSSEDDIIGAIKDLAAKCAGPSQVTDRSQVI